MVLGLQGCAGSTKARTEISLRPLYSTAQFRATLLTYQSDDLTLNALVATPHTDAPTDGYPTIIANHGFVPDPSRYGIGRDGVDARPGDYYRAIPASYARQGFRVVMPDYRGHSNSSGGETLTDDIWHNISRYADDVVALIDSIDRLPETDSARLFLWSHSMGGPVSSLTLQRRPVFLAASFWSPMSLTRSTRDYPKLKAEIVIHHAEEDATTPLANAQAFTRALAQAGVAHQLHVYPGGDHLLTEEQLARAVQRDVKLFKHVDRSNESTDRRISDEQ
ncbi:MAG: alpha/beta fold hydrolase [Pseudomonadota bacterium]